MSYDSSFGSALNELTGSLNSSGRADLALVFTPIDCASEFLRLMPLLRNYLAFDDGIGLAAGGVIATDAAVSVAELERQPTSA